MSFTITALQLVNRVNRLRRIEDSASIASHEELATLDCINRSISEVLAARRWEFDLRSLQIVTRARVQGVSITANADATTALLLKTGLTDSDVFGEYVTRIIPNGASTLGETGIRVVSATQPLVGFSTVTVQAPFRETVSTLTGEIAYSEYLLPDSVSNVVNVTHQQETLRLEEVGAKIEFSGKFPRPTVQYGKPEFVSVGGFEIPTFKTGDPQPKPMLKMNLWPVPDDEYLLDITYDVRHEELTGPESVLDGVPPEVVSTIVELATSSMQANYDRRVDDARKLRRDAIDAMEEVHERHSGMYAERSSVGSWDSGRSKYGYSIHRGRLIGGG